MAGDKNLPAPLTGFGQGNTERRRAATEAFGEGMASLDLDALDGAALDEAPEEKPKAKSDPKEMLADTRFRRSQPKDAQARAAEAQAKAEAERPQAKAAKPAAAPESPALELALDDDHRAQLEPVSDSAHPPQNRRMPTQPGLEVAAVPAVLEEQDTASYSTRAPVIEDDAKTAAYPSVANGQIPLPPPPKLGGPSPSPTPVRRGLFSYDRPTNLLAGAAIGLLLTIFPAKKMAEKYEQEKVVPLITDLEGAIDHPLGVQAGLVEKPASIAARIEDGRGKARQRFFMVWLLAGIPIGLGIGFIPRN
ncbi:MAG: hypothetical protein KC431_07930 [Myxococcales bacterium]|nr:hypothetical protein [Myxococcales bacterium]MCA9697438.1 hypothetical protein [Myxococcales bacterium]